jgi:hypothetical protein
MSEGAEGVEWFLAPGSQPVNGCCPPAIGRLIADGMTTAWRSWSPA